MKKIIMAVAAIAMVASMFAADVAAKVVLSGNLFKFDSASKTVNVLGLAEGNQGWNPLMNLSVSGDKAGAGVKFYDIQDVTEVNNGAMRADGWQIWFKPIDMLKFTVGNFGTNLNQETIDWTHTETSIDKFGYALTLTPIDGLSIDAFLQSDLGSQYDNPQWWMTKEDGKDVVMKMMYFKVAYGADFGNIGAFLKLFDQNDKNKIVIGAGYKNTFDPVTMFVNAMVYLNDGFAGIRVEPFATMNISGIGLSFFVPVKFAISGAKMYTTNNDRWKIGSGIDYWPHTEFTDNQLVIGTSAKITFPLGSMGGYVYICDKDWLAKDFELEIKPGITANIGAMSLDLALDVTLKKPDGGDFSAVIQIPAGFTVAW